MLNKMFRLHHKRKLKKHGNAVRELKKRIERSFKNGAGFTLIEVVVAVSVLLIGVLGTFTVVQNITFSSRINSSKLTAAYLAQEGLELVRNQRDTNWLEDMYLQPVSWDNNKVDLMEFINTLPTTVLGKFTREIDIEDRGDYIVVSVTVSWQERGSPYSITAKTELYNWK